ncbi:MAG: hypothetical protein K2I76_02430, partial [Malacoplasma sp.]|nr:hypothetical protein [Malacoplasma sp.]
SIGFNKIKQIIKNLKNDIDSFQEKIINMSSFKSTNNKNTINKNLNPITKNDNINSINNFNILSSDNTFSENNKFQTKKEKINSFTKERAKRIQEVKKQLNFLDGVLVGSNLSEHYKNPNYLKLSSFQEILKNDEINSKNPLEKESNINKEENKEKLLNNLIKEINEVSVDTNENTINSQDFIVTHEFLETLKSQGKEISENFIIKEKENISTKNNDNSWLTEFEDEVKDELVKKEIDKNDLINLIYKK